MKPIEPEPDSRAAAVAAARPAAAPAAPAAASVAATAAVPAAAPAGRAPVLQGAAPPPATPGRYAVLGHPVAHSRSPFIHAAFAAQTAQAVDFGVLDCGPDGFDAAVRRFAADGAQGCCVTVPFKHVAAAMAAQVTPRARLAGAANVLRFDAGGWWADNSDGVGLLRDIEGDAATPVAGARVLLIGAGGAAAGVLGPLLAARPAAVVVANRGVGHAHTLVARHAAWAQAHGVALAVAGLDVAGQAPFDIVVNATSSSLAGAAPPVPARVLGRGALAVDLMYGDAAAPWLAWAAAHGARGRDGLGMLVEQAAEAFVAWRGVRPRTAPVLAALRRTLAGGVA